MVSFGLQNLEVVREWHKFFIIKNVYFTELIEFFVAGM
jgi:hypothetical protein